MRFRSNVLRIACICAAVLAITLTFGLLASPGAYAAGPVFTDLPESDVYYPFVNYLVKTNLIQGYPDGSFHPDGSLTRAEAAAMLARADKIAGQAPAVPTYSDVGPEHWAYTVVEEASRAGLVEGYPDGTFRPEEPVSRAEACALLLRLTNMPLPGDITLSDAVKDVRPDHWARQQITVALQAGLFTVAQKSSFAPEAGATRAQMARGLATILNIDPERNKVPLTCTIVPVKGKVTIIEPGKSPVNITAATAVQTGATIKTGAGSQAELNFSDGSGMRLDAGSTMTITEARGQTTILKDGTPGTIIDYLKLDLPKGRLFGALANTTANKDETNTAGSGPNNIQLAYAATGLPAGLNLAEAETEGQDLQWWQSAYEEKVRVEVDMPWGVASVRGTFWMNEVGPGYNITSVVDGQIYVTSGSGQPVTVPAGQATSITSSGTPPTPPAPLTPEQQKVWQEVKDWVEGRVDAIEQNAPVVNPPVPVEQQTGQEQDNQTQPPHTGQDVINNYNQSTGGGSQNNNQNNNTNTGGGGGSSSSNRYITGTVSLPAETVAGSEIRVAVRAESDGYSSTPQAVSIPGGGSSATYALTIPAAYTSYNYRVSYYVQDSYVQAGYYSTGGTTAYLDEATPVSVSAGSRTGVNLTLIRGYAVSGTVSLPAGGPENVRVAVGAVDESRQYSWGTELTISSGSAGYTLYVPAGYGYRVKYNIKPGSGYVQQGYYANGATTAYYITSSIVDMSSGDLSGVNLELIRGKEISGTLSLPQGGTAPAGGIAAEIFAQSDPYQFSWSVPVTIPAEASSAGYTLNVPVNGAGAPYRVSYQQTSSSSYAQRGYYSYSITTPNYNAAEWVGVREGNRSGINLSLLSGNTISGKVRLPEGQQAPANLNVMVEAMLTDGYPPNGWTDIVIPQGQNYAEYSLLVPAASGYLARYSVKGMTPNCVLQGYYSGVINVSEGNAVGKDLTILTGSAISGAVSLPGGATAAGNISLGVAAVNSETLYSGVAYVTIPNGANSANYSLVVPDSIQGYIVNYQISYPVQGYMQMGNYSNAGTTISSSDITLVSSGSQGINLTLIPAGVVRGTVSLPPATAAEEDISLDVVAYKQQGGISFGAHVIIPTGNSDAGYRLVVPREPGYTLFYVLNPLNAPGYMPCGFYVSNSETTVGSVYAALIDASGGDVTANLRLVPIPAQGTPPAPAIIAITAADGGGDVELGSGDTLTIFFDLDTNQPVVGSKAAVDALIDFGAKVFGADYAGVWTNTRTLVLTVSDATYGTLAVGDILAIKGSGGLKTADGQSPASTAGGLISGSFNDETPYEATFSSAVYTASTDTLELTTERVEAGGTFDPGKLTYRDGSGNSRSLQGTYQADAGLDSAGDYKYTAGDGTAGTLTIILAGADATAIEGLAGFDTNGIVTGGADTVEAAPAWAAYNGKAATPVAGKNVTIADEALYEASFSAAVYTASTDTLELTTDEVEAGGTFDPGKLTYWDGNGNSRSLQGTYQADAGPDSAGDYKYTAGGGMAGTLTIMLDSADATAIEALAGYDTDGIVVNGADSVEATVAWAVYNGKEAAPVAGKNVTVAVGEPFLITGMSPSEPSGMKPTYYTNKGIRWGRYTYWPFDDYNNYCIEYVVAYDQLNNIVGQWTYNLTASSGRYIDNVLIDNSAKTFTFTTNQPNPGTVSIVVNPYYLYSLYSTIFVESGQEVQTAGGTFDVTFNLTLTDNQFASSGNGVIVLGGVFAGKSCIFTRTGDTTATLRIQGVVSAGPGTFQIPAGRFVGSSQNSNIISITVNP